ncbi:MAG: hypothetical protein ACREP0_08735 [Rhodanobacteraceae bacterium]
MLTVRPVRLLLAGAIALAVSGMASVAMAQMPPPPPQPQQPMSPPPPQQPMQPSQSQAGQPSGQFYQGTESTAQYPLQGSNGGTLTVHAGMPAEAPHYGPPPPFSSLDTNHNGRIDEAEAKAYPPLDSDFLFASGGAKTISKAQYQKWAKAQFQH